MCSIHHVTETLIITPVCTTTALGHAAQHDAELLFEVLVLDASIEIALCLVFDVLTHYQKFARPLAAQMHNGLPGGEFFLCWLNRGPMTLQLFGALLVRNS